MRDLGASVLARLKMKSLQLHLRLFCQEEFMRRLAISHYADNLILKGGLLLFALSQFDSRATTDIDFLLKRVPGTAEDVSRIVEEIINIPSGHDFVTFEMRNFQEIMLHRKYQGISVQLIGRIKNTVTSFTIDLGIGDVVVPKIEKRLMPTQLADFEPPEIKTYSLGSTVAGKFDAMLERMELTSRLKDYYDIHFLATTFDFDGRILQEAIMATLENRGTAFDASSFTAILSFAEDPQMITKWKHFLRKSKLPSLEFKDVLNILELFLGEIWNAMITEDEWLMMWDCQTRRWLVYSEN